MTNSNLIHNIAGELASKYVSYLAKMAMGQGLSHSYFKGNWKSEYNSRVKIMTENPNMIEKLNGFNDFFKCDIKQNNDIRRKFYFEN